MQLFETLTALPQRETFAESRHGLIKMHLFDQVIPPRFGQQTGLDFKLQKKGAGPSSLFLTSLPGRLNIIKPANSPEETMPAPLPEMDRTKALHYTENSGVDFGNHDEINMTKDLESSMTIDFTQHLE